jgi:murein DD-endopeptidase MepM/ murein hydrolase activator NlpD
MLLRAQGVATDVTARVVTAAAEVFDPRRLRASQPFMLARTLEGALRHFEYEIDADRLLRIIPVGIGLETLHAEVLPIPKTRQPATIAAVIDQDTPSLFQALGAAGERPELSIALAGVFSGEIDFNTELQPDDRFAVSFERFTRDQGPSTYGEITAAEFSSGGRVIRAIRFTPPGGLPGYYDDSGRSLRRFFLRSPLKFEPRITSRFSRGRMHPALHVNRAHRGVDYGAPQGSPVVAVASGTVVSASYDGTNGRMVRLRHSSGYESYYLHLSAFASGVRAGTRVSQSDVIGYVGATGLATGPHLHYGLRKNGVFVNPLVEHRNMPPGDPVPETAMEAFLAVRDRGLAQLSAAANSLTR